jgi:hypothetical protein
MASFKGITTILVAAVIPVLACNKGNSAADAGTATAVADAAPADTSAAAAAAADAAAAAAPSASAAAAHTCAAYQKAFYGNSGAALCETACVTDNDCKLPATCWGAGQLLNADGSMGKAAKFCKGPSAATTCPRPNEAAFYGHGGSTICSTFCTKDTQCSAPQTCAGAGQRLDGDGKMGPVEHYCK